MNIDYNAGIFVVACVSLAMLYTDHFFIKKLNRLELDLEKKVHNDINFCIDEYVSEKKVFTLTNKLVLLDEFDSTPQNCRHLIRTNMLISGIVIAILLIVYDTIPANWLKGMYTALLIIAGWIFASGYYQINKSTNEIERYMKSKSFEDFLKDNKIVLGDKYARHT